MLGAGRFAASCNQIDVSRYTGDREAGSVFLIRQKKKKSDRDLPSISLCINFMLIFLSLRKESLQVLF